MLALSISLFSSSMQTTDTKLAGLERVNAQSDAPDYGAKNIALLEITNITINGTLIKFSEILPLNSSYTNDLSNFSQFVQNFSQLNNSLNITEAQRPKFYINPYSISFDHPAAGNVSITPLESNSSSGQLNAYHISVTINQNVPRIEWGTASEVPSSSPDAIYINITAKGSVQSDTSAKYINKSKYSDVIIGGKILPNNPNDPIVGNANEPKVLITINSPAALNLSYIPGNQMSQYIAMPMNLTLQFNSTSLNTSVELGRNIINVTLGSETERIGQVIIVED